VVPLTISQRTVRKAKAVTRRIRTTLTQAGLG
jgi:hypothetical protein